MFLCFCVSCSCPDLLTLVLVRHDPHCRRCDNSCLHNLSLSLEGRFVLCFHRKIYPLIGALHFSR